MWVCLCVCVFVCVPMRMPVCVCLCGKLLKTRMHMKWKLIWLTWNWNERTYQRPSFGLLIRSLRGQSRLKRNWTETEPKLKPLLKQKEAIMTKMKSLKHSAAAREGEGRQPWSSCPFGRLKANKIEQQQQQQQKAGRAIQKNKRVDSGNSNPVCAKRLEEKGRRGRKRGCCAFRCGLWFRHCCQPEKALPHLIYGAGFVTV